MQSHSRRSVPDAGSADGPLPAADVVSEGAAHTDLPGTHSGATGAGPPGAAGTIRNKRSKICVTSINRCINYRPHSFITRSAGWHRPPRITWRTMRISFRFDSFNFLLVRFCKLVRATLVFFHIHLRISLTLIPSSYPPIPSQLPIDQPTTPPCR